MIRRAAAAAVYFFIFLAGAEPQTPGTSLDPEGVAMIFPSAPGSEFRLGSSDPNAAEDFSIEGGVRAQAGTDGAVRFWNVPSHALAYSGGGSGWTSRLHIRSGSAVQRFTWQTQTGYLSTPRDFRNQEFTAFIRVHGLLDATRAQISLKIRGGGHSASRPEYASCAMLTFAPQSGGRTARFGKELTHPLFDFVTLEPNFPAALEADRWFGLKLTSWNDPLAAGRVVNRLYLDMDPFPARTGKPGNNWRLFSEYVDAEGVDTGRYSKTVDWGGCQTTLRMDGYRSLDFALVSVREIKPPAP